MILWLLGSHRPGAHLCRDTTGMPSCRRRWRRSLSSHFGNFDPVKVAAFDDRRLGRLLQDAGIIRNRLKIYGARSNAQAFIRVQAEFGSFANSLWSWVDVKRIVNHPRTLADLTPTTALSDRLSKDLKRRGFTFVGSTIVYSFLQSVGIVDDHLVGCPFKRP
jgi:DNA-3-methyladenine glycosylase I